MAIEGTPPSEPPKTLTFEESKNLFWLLLILHGALIAGEIYIAWKQGWI